MRAKTVAATALSAGALSIVGMSVPALGAAGSYPPGRHTADFGQSSYHRNAHAHFTTGNAFFASERVLAILRCNHRRYSHGEGPFRAHNHHVTSSITVPGNAPKSFCTLYLTGSRSGEHASGGFRVH